MKRLLLLSLCLALPLFSSAVAQDIRAMYQYAEAVAKVVDGRVLSVTDYQVGITAHGADGRVRSTLLSPNLDLPTLTSPITLKVETIDSELMFRVHEGQIAYLGSTVRRPTTSTTTIRGVTAPSHASPSFTCTSTTDATGHRTTCYQDGRRVYEMRCQTFNGRTTCTSRDY